MAIKRKHLNRRLVKILINHVNWNKNTKKRNVIKIRRPRSKAIFQIRNNSNQIFEFSLEQDAHRVDDPLKCQHLSISFALYASVTNRFIHSMRCWSWYVTFLINELRMTCSKEIRMINMAAALKTKLIHFVFKRY